jgi:hypothetical protein
MTAKLHPSLNDYDQKASDLEAIVESVVGRKLKPIEKILVNPPEDTGCGTARPAPGFFIALQGF